MVSSSSGVSTQALSLKEQNSEAGLVLNRADGESTSLAFKQGYGQDNLEGATGDQQIQLPKGNLVAPKREPEYHGLIFRQGYKIRVPCLLAATN